jgi:hypothetical protein
MPATASKKKQWKGLKKDLGRTADGLGKGVDKGIRPAVIALQSLGFKTTAACEGHRGRGCCYPWIHVGLPEKGKKRTAEIARLRRLVDEFYDDSYQGDAALMCQALGSGGAVRIQAQAANILDKLPGEILTPKKRSRINKRYMKEMDRFAKFLKDKFFS